MSLEQAIESAQRANTMVYSIYFEGQEFSDGGRYPSGGGGYPGGGRYPRGGGNWPGGGYPGGGNWPGGGYPGGGYPGGGRRYPGPISYPEANGKRILERLSRETGGRMFVVSNKEPIGKIYAQIEDELRNQYNLGYTPERGSDNTADYHHIQVTTTEKDLKVQAREGYYASRPLNGASGK